MDSFLRQPPCVSNKRKRDSEPRNLIMNRLQLRDSEAQEKVEQKHAKIAAPVPAGRSASASVTALADLYAQMHHNSGVSGRQPTSTVVTNTVPKNGQIQS